MRLGASCLGTLIFTISSFKIRTLQGWEGTDQDFYPIPVVFQVNDMQKGTDWLRISRCGHQKLSWTSHKSPLGETGTQQQRQLAAVISQSTHPAYTNYKCIQPKNQCGGLPMWQKRNEVQIYLHEMYPKNYGSFLETTTTKWYFVSATSSNLLFKISSGLFNFVWLFFFYYRMMFIHSHLLIFVWTPEIMQTWASQSLSVRSTQQSSAIWFYYIYMKISSS